MTTPPPGRSRALNVVGAPIKRLEDPRLLIGGGRYVDDVVRSGMVHAVIVRSVHANARVRRVDVRRAAAHPGVLACLTSADLGATPPIPIRLGAKPAHTPWLQPPLAGDRVRYVGEPVAVVVAADRVSAVDARELVEIEYGVLPALVDAGDASEDNVADSWTTSIGNVDAALRDAACVVRERFPIGRQTGVPMETRGLVPSGMALRSASRYGDRRRCPTTIAERWPPCSISRKNGSTSRSQTSAAVSASAASSIPRTSSCHTWPAVWVATFVTLGPH